MTRRTNAFTLIELLVVISIIALLIAILLPTLQSARATARAAQCLVTLKQFAMASTVYTVDYNGTHLPFAWQGAASEPTYWWWRNDDFQRIMLDAGTISAANWGTELPRELLCPESDIVPGVNGFMYESYHMNPTNLPYTTAPSGFYVPWTPNKINAFPEMLVNNPSETMFFVDKASNSWNLNYSQRDDYVDETTNSSGPAFRHPGDSANLSFFDGHGERLPRKVLASPDDDVAARYWAVTREYGKTYSYGWQGADPRIND